MATAEIVSQCPEAALIDYKKEKKIDQVVCGRGIYKSTSRGVGEKLAAIIMQLRIRGSGNHRQYPGKGREMRTRTVSQVVPSLK